jgi:recombination protein RecR
LTPLLQQLIQSLRCLPGIGPKSAQRIAFQLLARNRDGAKMLATSLVQAMDNIGYCHSCRTFSETELCTYCSSTRRDKSIMCIVESPADQYAIEQTGYNGMYFILHGRLSPLDGIGPADIGMDLLRQRLHAEETVREIIVATNPTLEGEATAHYIAQIAKHRQISCSRIAHGVPLGGELESIDIGTLTHAFAGRGVIQDS